MFVSQLQGWMSLLLIISLLQELLLITHQSSAATHHPPPNFATMDMFNDREDLMTPEELEEYNHEPSSEEIPTFTDEMKHWLFRSDHVLMTPEKEHEAEFRRRRPALGLTMAQLDVIRQHNTRILPVQQRKLFKGLRDTMLRLLISTSGASTLEHLLQILAAEIDSGTPAPIPSWYTFSNVRFGPRRIGYEKCEHRGCAQTETTEKRFPNCGQCKIAHYCSKACQTADWMALHKHICKDVKKKRDMMIGASSFLNNLNNHFG
jgi:hypothetical protein